MPIPNFQSVLASEQLYRLSDLRKRPVYLGDRKIGWLDDFVVVDRDIVADVTHVCVHRPFGQPPYYVPWRHVQSLAGRQVVIDPKTNLGPLEQAPEAAVLLQDYIVDKKVLDVQGREVEVVYDALLAIIRIHFYVVGVDLSKRAMLRRIGLGWLARLVARTDGERVVPWNMVEPLPENLGSFAGDIRLKVLKEELAKMEPTDTARILEELSNDQRLAIIEGLGVEHASDTLEELDPKSQRDVIAAMPKDKAAKLIDEMTPGQAADVLSALPWSQTSAILRHLDKEQAARVNEIMQKQDEEVIDYMIDDFIRLAPEHTVQQARQACQSAQDKQALAYLYVVDAQDRLVGVVHTAELLRAADQAPVKQIMESSVVFLNSDDTLKEAAQAFARYGYRALPVVDKQGKLLGIVPSRDVMGLEHRYIE